MVMKANGADVYVISSSLVDSIEPDERPTGDVVIVDDVGEISSVARTHNSICVVVQYNELTPFLVQVLQREGKPFGIIPLGRSVNALGRRFDLSAVVNSPTVLAYVSASAIRFGGDFLGDEVEKRVRGLNGSYFGFTPGNGGAFKELLKDRPEPLDIVGMITEGRQTYCNFDGGCLHPTIDDRDVGIVGTKDIRARHWFIQSCHNPYAWKDYENYLSVPMSLIVNNDDVVSVVCSCRVQIAMPRVLELYFELAMAGVALGEIVHTLNRFVNVCSMDRDPFLLLGDPGIRIVEGSGCAERASGERAEWHALSKRNGRFVRRVLENLDFMTCRHNFDFQRCGSECSNICNQLANSLGREAVHTYYRQIGRKVANLAETLVEAWQWLGPGRLGSKNHDNSLVGISRRVNRMFLLAGGYYYHIGPQLGRSYDGCGVGRWRGELLDGGAAEGASQVRHVREYVGICASEENAKRVYRVDDRNLIYGDLAENLDEGLRAERRGKRFAFEFRNRDSISRWVFGNISCTDPNNVSWNVSRRSYEVMLDRVNMAPSVEGRVFKGGNRAGEERGRVKAVVFPAVEVMPGDVYRMECDIDWDGDGAPVFYLLIEACIFVDFVWNWLSVTHRGPSIGGWLRSEEYRKSLPARRQK